MLHWSMHYSFHIESNYHNSGACPIKLQDKEIITLSVQSAYTVLNKLENPFITTAASQNQLSQLATDK